MRLGLLLVVLGVFVPLVAWVLWGQGYVPRIGLGQCLPNMKLVFGVGDAEAAALLPLNSNARERMMRGRSMSFPPVLAGGIALTGIGLFLVISGLLGVRPRAAEPHSDPRAEEPTSGQS